MLDSKVEGHRFKSWRGHKFFFFFFFFSFSFFICISLAKSVCYWLANLGLILQKCVCVVLNVDTFNGLVKQAAIECVHSMV